MQEKTLKKVWYGSIVLYIGTLAFAFGYNLYTKNYHSVGMAFVAVLTPCIVPLIFKLCHWNVVYEIYILSNVLPILPACGEEHWTLIVFMALIKRSIFPADG